MTVSVRYRAVLFDLHGTLVDSCYLDRFADLLKIAGNGEER